MLCRRLMLGLFATTLAFVVIGCADEELVESTEPLPQAYADPNNANLNSGDGAWDNKEGAVAGSDAWGDGASDSSVGAGNGAGDNWAPVDADNNLGFPIIYFGYDADSLNPSERAKLDGVAKYLTQQATLGLIVEGHCDQRGTEEYNRGLGERRANSIRTYLNGQGISDERIKTLSFGEDRPVSGGANGESAWSKDRRGVLIPARIQ